MVNDNSLLDDDLRHGLLVGLEIIASAAASSQNNAANDECDEKEKADGAATVGVHGRMAAAIVTIIVAAVASTNRQPDKGQSVEARYRR